MLVFCLTLCKCFGLGLLWLFVGRLSDCLGGLVLLLIVLVSVDVARIYSYLLFWLFLMFYCWVLVLVFLGCFDVLLLL